MRNDSTVEKSVYTIDKKELAKALKTSPELKDKFFHNKTITVSSGNTFENGILVFEDIVRLDDRAVQKIAREVDKRELEGALRGASPELQDKFFRNMSKNSAKMLKEDMSIGSISVNAIERSQENILFAIKCIENRGEIVIFGNSMIELGSASWVSFDE